MKTVNKYLFLLAAAVFGLTACEKQQEREPSPEGNPNAVAFEQSAYAAEINPNKEALEFEIKVTRSAAESALTVNIASEGDIDVIKVPATVSFAAGEKEVALKLTFPTAQVDASYAVSLSIGKDNQSPYTSGASECTFSVSIASWEAAAAPAVFVDGLVCSPFGMEPIAWYVPFQEKTNADGSKDFRFLNPYRASSGSEEADNFGVYSWFVYNSGEDVDLKNTYNWEIHVDAEGNATFEKTYIGVDYSYGPALAWMTAGFYAEKNGTEPDYATYGAGVYDDAAKTITIPAGVMLWYFEGYGGNLTSLPQIIYLDSKAYQDDHILIADFNGSDIEWKEQESVVNLFESTIFNFSNEDQKLFKAVDPYEGNPKSPFINLYCLKDAYAAGGNLAFYWNGEDGALDIPVPQNTKLSFMQKDLFIVEAAGQVATNNVKGTDVKVFTFDIIVATKDGNLVGEFVETFSLANENIVFSKSDFIGNFTIADPDGAEDIEIKDIDGNLAILGVQYADTIWCDFNAETGALSIAPQKLDSLFGKYDITLYTIVGKNYSTKATVDVVFGLSGIARVAATSEASGFHLVSNVAGGAVAGYENFTLTPIAAPASVPAKAPSIVRTVKKEFAGHRANKPSVNHLSFKGAYSKRIKASVDVF
ncbi:MAG: hypothetical protein IKO26_07420 [Paludibacteraceae bacterium]|nr:hypothetical protein [Paludibacteraceae bacterium]